MDDAVSSPNRNPHLRRFCRVAALTAALLLALAGPLPNWLVKIIRPSDTITPLEILPGWGAGMVPALSPSVALHELVAQRTVFTGLPWLLLPAALAMLAYYRGRFFCGWFCPTGTIFHLPSLLSRRKKLFRVSFGAFFFWAGLAGAVLGLPLFLALDPLAQFNRLTVLLNGIISPALLIPALLIPIFFLLSFIQPACWCSHFCPLGYFFSAMHRLRGSSPQKSFDPFRRELLTGVLIGLPTAWLVNKLSFSREAPSFPVLPPGADNPEHFASLCTRCYACVKVCPTGILQPSIPNHSRLVQWFQPEMNPNRGACEEHCRLCTEVCPTGAIRTMTIAQKRRLQLGIAEVNRAACLAWADNEYCLICAEYCPYNAIRTDHSTQGIPRPIVAPELCRGCGFCQHECPAKRRGKAIIVCGIKKQIILDADRDGK